MRKITLLLVVLLMFGSTVYANEITSFVGRSIEGQFPVTVDGEKIEQPGLVVNGTSYLPVRTISELVGCDIDFVDKEIIMYCKKEDVPSDVQMNSKFKDVPDERIIDSLNADRKTLEIVKDRYEKEKKIYDPKSEILQRKIDAINELEEEIAEKEAELKSRGIELD